MRSFPDPSAPVATASPTAPARRTHEHALLAQAVGGDLEQDAQTPARALDSEPAALQRELRRVLGSKLLTEQLHAITEDALERRGVGGESAAGRARRGARVLGSSFIHYLLDTRHRVGARPKPVVVQYLILPLGVRPVAVDGSVLPR